ncbi:MAG: hypothetical protein HDR23_08560 [Lachnospiraceae bacterium]|nr:hypothetical protein [Lachnospiraceae bacterium]
MNDNYTKWLEKEKEWVNAVEKKCKRDTWKYSLLTVAGCVVVLGAIGLLAAGGINIQGMLQNMLIGLAWGIIIIPFMFIFTKPTWPAKRYIAELKSEIEDVLSPEDREEFASQMLGSDVKRISWIDEEKREERVLITKDYAFRVTGRGMATMVELQKVKRVTVDVRELTISTRSRGLKIQETATSYPMYFYYRLLSEGDKEKYDKEFIFTRREDREKVSHILNEMKIGDQRV